MKRPESSFTVATARTNTGCLRVKSGLALLAMIFLAAAGTAAAIDIASIEDLQKIGNDPAYPLDGSYVLTQDIDASATASWNGGAGFDPIGYDYNRPFTGMIDGQEHVITGLHINRPTADYAGLFGCVAPGAELKNLGIEGGMVVGDVRVGGLVGQNNGRVSNCYATGSGSGNRVGGLVGYNDTYGMVSNCYATGAVSGDFFDGGLVGDNYGRVSNCYATGSVTGSGGIGGLVGGNDGGTVLDCYATGMVAGRDYVGSVVGGLVGSNVGGTVSSCYATGAASGMYYVGGLVGSNNGTVSDCYATGAVSGDGDHLGGLVGSNDGGTVSNCYATGAAQVTSTTPAGSWAAATAARCRLRSGTPRRAAGQHRQAAMPP